MSFNRQLFDPWMLFRYGVLLDALPEVVEVQLHLVYFVCLATYFLSVVSAMRLIADS